MKRGRLSIWRLAALGSLLLAVVAGSTGGTEPGSYGPGRGDRPPEKNPLACAQYSEINQLRGIVVCKKNGRPAPGVPVVMAHGEKGYAYFTDSGLSGGGGDERILDYFIKRNSKRFCLAVTDDEGRFTLANFAAPDEPWNLAAGDEERGLAMQIGLCPEDHRREPLRIELEEPAYLTATLPAVPKPLRAYLRVKLAPEKAGRAPSASEGTPPKAEAIAKDAGADEDADKAPRVYFDVPRSPERQKPVRIGPLPGGQRYRVMVYASGRKVPYQATMFARTVSVAPGATEDVALESASGATLAGRITGPDDQPLGQINVMVETADGLTIGTLTDDHGKYALGGVPAGTHKLKLLRHAERKTPG